MNLGAVAHTGAVDLPQSATKYPTYLYIHHSLLGLYELYIKYTFQSTFRLSFNEYPLSLVTYHFRRYICSQFWISTLHM